jgi:hypothetical protein
MKEPLFTEDDFYACSWNYTAYFLEVLNGEYDLEDARNDLRGLIGSKYDSRIQNEQSDDI